jgi:hypothetical protein
MIEKLSIITLDDNKRYVVVEILKEREHEYLFLNQIDDNEELLEEKIIVENIKTDNGYIINPIEDKDIITNICQKFLKNI